MWEIQHLLLDEALPAAIGVTAAGAMYYVTDKIWHRRNKAKDMKRREAEYMQIAEHVQRAKEAREAELQNGFDPETTLKKLQEYRKRDPEFRIAIDHFVEAEAMNIDPLEGKPLPERASPSNPLQRKVREMLDA